MVTRLQPRGQPEIAVDTKKKELVGPFKNGGREWQPKGEPEEVDRHDFPDLQLGKVISSGVVDLSQNEGWVSVGIDHETAQFAGASHRPVVEENGCQAIPRCPGTIDHGRRRGQPNPPFRDAQTGKSFLKRLVSSYEAWGLFLNVSLPAFSILSRLRSCQDRHSAQN
jgi:hypothetical protein